MRLYPLALLALLVTACTNEGASDAAWDSTTAPKDTLVTVDAIVPAPAFHQYMLLVDSSYSTANYAPAGSIQLDMQPSAPLDSALLSSFSELLVYDSDRTKALDLFSGNYLMITKGGKTKAERGEPDTELAIVDYGTKRRTRLLYVGPSYLLTDAVWITDSTIGVTGGELIGADKMQPLLWKISLPHKTAALYRYTHTIDVKMEDYFQKRYYQLPL